MLGVLIIVFNPLANLRRGHANDGVRVRVVVGWPAEDFHTYNAFFELVGLPFQYTGNNKPQETGISLAGVEQR